MFVYLLLVVEEFILFCSSLCSCLLTVFNVLMYLLQSSPKSVSAALEPNKVAGVVS